MPVVGTTAYNTAGQITALVRSLLNDAAGNLFTDTVLLPYVNAAYRKAQRTLANVQSGSFLTDNVLLVVSAVPAVDASVQVSITDATAPPNQLPPDLLVPSKLWERPNLSTNDFVEMVRSDGSRWVAIGAAGAGAAVLGVARGWIVFFGRDAGHADSFAVSEIVSGPGGCDEPGADSQFAGSAGVCGGGHGGRGARSSSGGAMGCGGGGCAGGFAGAGDAAGTADGAQAAAVFFEGWVCAADLGVNRGSLALSSGEK